MVLAVGVALLVLVAYQSPSSSDPSGGVPRGTVVAWYTNQVSGASVQPPVGWRVCDGSNGTPDLRNRFILGAQGPVEIGMAGGASVHNHLGLTSSGGGGYVGGPTIVQDFKRPTGIDYDSAATEDHTHEIPAHQHSFVTADTSHLPPYFKLLYIIKVGL